MHSALGYLLRRKLVGVFRKQTRRMRRPAGWITALVGLAVLVLWVGALLWRGTRGDATPMSPQRLVVVIQTAGLLFTLMTVAGAFAHRGLYLPKDEIELLFSAPISRADIVRYRLLVGCGRSTFGALALGLVAWRHLPSPLYGLMGIFVAAQTLPVLGQGVSILLGDVENRWHAAMKGLRPLRAMQTVAIVCLVGAVGLFVLPLALGEPGLSGKLLGIVGVRGGLGGLLDQPWLARAGAPLRPWALMITAPDAATFWPLFGFALLAAFLLVQIVVNLKVDFRELSLATSADIAQRVNRRRKSGGVASGSAAASGSAGWRVPWVFGRGPAGAIAWRKSCSILRKARGTILTSLLIVGGLTITALFIDQQSHDGGLGGSLMIGGVGALYLCAGLRFDFREDLDAMESLKAWPVRPWQLFLATLVPEVVLVSGLLVAAILLRRLPGGFPERETLMVALGVPVVTFLWIAIDNAVFLFLPVRFTPGQEGALQHTGRGIALLLLRMLAFGLVAAAAGAALASHLLLEDLGLQRYPAIATAAGLFALVVCAEVIGVIAIGGFLLKRFDVARDRG